MKIKVLLEACLNNNLDKVEERLSSGDDPNESTGDYAPALSICSYYGFLDIARLLISKGAKATIKDRDWMTPLHYASMSGNTESARFLLGNGADISARDKMWRTPYHIAAALDRYDLLELLVSGLKILNTADRQGWNTMHYAAFNGRSDNVRLLIALGLSPKFTDKYCRTPLHYAAFNGHVDIINILISSGALIDSRDNKVFRFMTQGLTPLHIAAMKSHRHACDQLLRHKADIYAKTSDGNTAFNLCCFTGNVELIDYFSRKMDDYIHLNKNGQIFAHLLSLSQVDLDVFNRYVKDDHLNYKGRAIVHYLAMSDRYAVFQYMEAKRIDLNAQDDNGWTALHYACHQQSIELVIILINRNADVNRQTNDGRTPLHVAVFTKNLDLIYILVKNGADINKVDYLDRTPVHYAFLCCNDDVSQYFCNDLKGFIFDSRQRSLLHYATLASSEEIFKKLIAHKYDLNGKDADGRTALHYASYFCHDDLMVYYLIQQHSVMTQDVYHFYPTHYAILAKQLTNASLLIEQVDMLTEVSPCVSILHIITNNEFFESMPVILKKYNKNHIPFDENNVTPIHIAASKGNLYHFLITSLLLKQLISFFDNSDIHTPEKLFGYTPVHLAVLFGHPDCLKALMEYSAFRYKIDTVSKDNLTALSLAIISTTCDPIYRYLIKNGANTNIPYSEHSIYPIHLACIRCNNSLLELLLKADAMVNQKTKIGKTAAHFAADAGSVPCLKILFKYGADLTLTDKYGYTPLHYASFKGFPEIIAFLVKKVGKDHILDGNLFSPVHCVVLNQSLECLKTLLKGLEDRLCIPDDQKATPLHLAASLDDTLIADVLILSGQNLNSTNVYGETPIHIAAKNQNTSMLEFLLTNDVDLSIMDNKGNTALHLASIYRIKENAIMISKKMNQEQLYLKNKLDQSALDICRMYNPNWDIFPKANL